MTSAEQTALVKQYCAGCHSERGKAGGLSLAAFDAADVLDHADTTEKMIRKLRAGMMPPAGARRPEPAVIDALATAFETRIDRAAALNPNPGSRPSQRLNRAEYTRAVKDLLAVDVDVNAYLPADTISDGFDNIADSQTISSTLDGRLPARGQPDQPARGGRSQRLAELHHLEGAAHGVADAARRGRAARHARRPVGAARVPGRRRLPLQDHAAHGPHRRPVRRSVSRRADRGVDQRRARRADGHQPAHERAGPERHDHADAEGPHQGGPASPVGGVRPALRRPGRRPDHADRAHAGRHQHRRSVRHHGADAPARLHRERPAVGDRRLRHREPPQDLHLPADQRRRRIPLRRRHRPQAGDPGLSRPGAGRRLQGADGVLRARPQGRRLRSRRPPGRAGHSRQPALPVPHGAGAGDAARRPDLPRQRPRPGVAPVVLRVGLGARRRTGEGRHAGHAADAGGVRPAVEAHAGRPALRGAVDALCLAVAAAAGRREGSSRSPLLFLLGHHAVAGAGARDRAVRRQPDPRGSAGHRPADRRPHVRQRAAGQALRHSRTSSATSIAA